MFRESKSDTAHDDRVVLQSEFGGLSLTVSAETGLPVAMTLGDEIVHLDVGVTLVLGGEEVDPPVGGLGYEGCREATTVSRESHEIIEQLTLDTREFRVPARVGSWDATWVYAFRASAPHVSLHAELTPRASDDRVLRNVLIDVRIQGLHAPSWLVHAPGNHLRPDLSLSQLIRDVPVSPPGGLKGSSGLIALERTADSPLLAVIWPFATQEISDVALVPQPEGLRVHFQTDLAGEPALGGILATGAIHLDLLATDWPSVLPELPDWLDELGVRGPENSPEWARGATIFEVQIGFSTFACGWEYAPYPTATDVLADLDRIQGLGFDTLQIMPQHPFPSYNVFEYDDVSTGWGELSVLQELVDTCHSRGMKVILDILLHGVVDKEAVAKAAGGVRNGPFIDRLDEVTPAIWLSDDDAWDVAYSRHIIDFEPYWSGGSEERHHLADEHPEWFGRMTDGSIIGIYTKSFDNGHPGWQDYFIAACARLVSDLHVDGFRFDAPTYNYFANWSNRARTRASTSMLGSVPLFRRLRRALKRINPDVLLYTEPSGVLLRQDMDVNYNYDEQWLFGAVLGDGSADAQEIITPRSISTWLHERDSALPRGSLTAHHVDSHDTFWWALPGSKWFRELYDAPRTSALTQLFALRGGPFMLFIGGETDIEDSLRRTLQLRARYPELSAGTPLPSTFDPGTDHIYSVEMRLGESRSLVMVNLSNAAQPFSGSINGDTGAVWRAVDMLGYTVVKADTRDGAWGLSGTLSPWTAAVIPLPRATVPARAPRSPGTLR